MARSWASYSTLLAPKSDDQSPPLPDEEEEEEEEETEEEASAECSCCALKATCGSPERQRAASSTKHKRAHQLEASTDLLTRLLLLRIRLCAEMTKLERLGHREHWRRVSGGEGGR